MDHKKHLFPTWVHAYRRNLLDNLWLSGQYIIIYMGLIELWELCCGLPQWYRTTSCTSGLLCDGIVWHHDVRWRHCMTSWSHVTSHNGFWGKRTVKYMTQEVHENWGVFISTTTVAAIFMQSKDSKGLFGYWSKITIMPKPEYKHTCIRGWLDHSRGKVKGWLPCPMMY